MARYSSYSNNTPITNWKNIPIYLTTILTALFVVGLVFRAVVDAARSDVWLWFAFTMPLVPVATVWRLVTYVFLGQLNFFTPLGIACFYMWSVGLETHLGRGVLWKLLALLALTVPAVASVWYLAFHVPFMYAGNYVFVPGVLIAFATLYPNAEWWGWIPFKWFAFACVFCGSLMLIANREVVELSLLWASCAVGFAFTHHAKEMEYDDSTTIMDRVRKLLPRKAKFRVLPNPSSASRQPAESSDTSEMDALLDKIAKNGITSLSAKERARLEKARESLMKRDQR